MFLLTHPLSVVKTLPREVVIADAGESLYWISHGRFLFLAVRDDGYENVYHVLPWHRYPTSNDFWGISCTISDSNAILVLGTGNSVHLHPTQTEAPQYRGVQTWVWCFNKLVFLMVSIFFCIFATATNVLILFTIAQDEIDGVSAFFSIIFITSSILVSFPQVFFC